MLKLDRSLPLRMQIPQAINRRLSIDHPRRRFIKNEIGRQEAGYSGEKNLDYYINLIPDKDFIVLKGLDLIVGSSQFQIDTLIIFKNFILNIDAKNYAGDLYFSSTLNQMHRTLYNKVEAFPNPITQVQIQNLNLTKWLSTHFLPNMPIEHLIFLSNPRTTVKTDPKNFQILNKISNGNDVFDKIGQIRSKMKKFDPYPNHELNKIKRKLIKLQTPPSLNLLRTYKIHPNEILPGAQCPVCFLLPLVRKHGTWYCQKCQNTYKDAHIQALSDYFLLISPTISNQQFRQFLLLESRDTAKRLLLSMKLPYTGANKDRLYYRPIDF